MVAEVACVLTVSERTAGALLSDCQALTTELPLTLAALQAGTISWQHARIMVDETADLDPAGAAALEAHFLDPDAPNPARGCPAGELVPGRFRAKARPGGNATTRSASKNATPSVPRTGGWSIVPDRDGMAWLSAYLPAETAAGIWDRTTAAARALQGPDEARTLTQLRADIAATWLLTGAAADGTDGCGTGGSDRCGRTGGRGGGRRDRLLACGGVPSPRAQVLVTVPVMSLLGATDEPAMLDGYGPIPPSMARRLIADGADSFHRVLTDPRDGAPLEIGRTSYRAHEGPAAMAPTPRRQMPVPRLQQPLPGQRSGPPPGLGRRRHHRDLQSRPALPQTPPPQTHAPAGHPPEPAKTTHRAGSHRRPELPQRTPGLGTTPLAGRHPDTRRIPDGIPDGNCPSGRSPTRLRRIPDRD